MNTIAAPKNWLILRGLTREQRHWFGFPEALTRSLGVNIELLDLPGVGTEHQRTSPWTVDEITFDVFDRFKVIREKDSEPWGIVGLSLGGMVGLTLCELYPDWFSHLVVINTSSRLSSTFERMRPRALVGIISALLEDEVDSREKLIYRMSTKLRRGNARDYALLATIFQETHPVRRATFARQLVAAARFRPPRELEQKVLVLASRGDELVAPECSRDLAERLGAELNEHPTAGHDLPLEDSEWIASRIANWLELGAGDHLHSLESRDLDNTKLSA